jgi:predicted DNA-binding transcriptional regulator AlpA
MTEALNAVQASQLCGVSERSWHRLSSQGKTPQPIRLGRSVRWRKTELDRWLAAGCPTRDAWRGMNAS